MRGKEKKDKNENMSHFALSVFYSAGMRIIPFCIKGYVLNRFVHA
jgi:hypothetical protein